MKVALAVSGSVGLFVLAASPVEARIACRDGYQRVAGNEIATPYCQDNYLAKVAREYGMKISDAAVRNNPNLKREVCRFVGRDSRVFENCIDENFSGRGK